MNTAAIYCRVSTENQEIDGTSLDTQRAACLKYCQEHTYTVTRQYIETFSGLTLERPQLDDLRQTIRNQEIDTLVVYCLDRLSRNPTHGVILFQELEKYSVKLEAVIEDIDNSELGKLISYIRGYAANLEAEKIRERTRRGIRAKVFDKGKPISYKRAPYGYSWDKDNNSLVKNSDYNTAKFILDSSINGKSYDWIIAELKRLGIPRPSGPSDKDGDITWNKHTISTIIRNPVYAGQFYAFKSEAVKPLNGKGISNKVKSSVKRLPQEQWHYLPSVKVESPIITLDQRSLLLDQLQQRQKLSSRNAKREYLLRGMILCETHKGKGGEPRRYHGIPKRDTYYYTCPVGGCEVPYIPGPWADKEVKGFFTKLLSQTPNDFFKFIARGEPKRDYPAEQKQLDTKYEKITNKLARIEDSNIDGKIDPEAYQRVKAKCLVDRQKIKDRQKAILDEMAVLVHEKEAIESWKQLRDRWLKRLIVSSSGGIKGYEAELENWLREHNPQLSNEDGFEDAIKEKARQLTDIEDWPEPMTDKEWRQVLVACEFQWIPAKDLRKSKIHINLPISVPDKTKIGLVTSWRG